MNSKKFSVKYNLASFGHFPAHPEGLRQSLPSSIHLDRKEPGHCVQPGDPRRPIPLGFCDSQAWYVLNLNQILSLIQPSETHQPMEVPSFPSFSASTVVDEDHPAFLQFKMGPISKYQVIKIRVHSPGCPASTHCPLQPHSQF